jgi:hypothetical protein
MKTAKRWIMLLLLTLGLGAWPYGCGPGYVYPEEEEQPVPDEEKELNKCADDSQMRPIQDPDWELVPGGAAYTGYLCPRGDIDHFWFNVAQPGTTITVNLANNVAMSPVDYCYVIFPQGENAPAAGNLCDHDGLDGVTVLHGNHYIEEPGTYFLEVRDESMDEEDSNNMYKLSIMDETDPDGYESNDGVATASQPAGAPGYISYLGDQDWYAIPVSGSGKIVKIELSTSAASPVDLTYTLFEPDGTTPINSARNWDGLKGAVSLQDALPVPQAGTYYLVVSDADDDDVDIEVGYNLQVSLAADPDSRDQNPRNDTFEEASLLSSGQTVSSAYLATRGDEDWYRIEASGVSGSNPGLLEIELQLDSGSPVDPAVDLLLADPDTPCSPGDGCEVLTQTCGGGSCGSSVECANAQCPSHECVTHLGKCSGGGVCLPGGCAVRSLTLYGADWSQTNNGRHLHTTAPMYASTYYILVRDFHADHFDSGRAYRLTVTIHQERDSHERPANGLWIPYADNEQEDETRSWNRSMASTVNCANDGGTINCTIEGYLSYRGDQDWYKLDSIPTGQNYDLQFPWSFSGNSAMIINYTMYLGGRAHTGFVESTGSGTWGTSGCVYICGAHHTSRPAYLRVMHKDRKEYDFQNPYRITVKAYPGCPSSCEHCVGDGYCPH